jgi:lysozyme family protein
MRINNRIKNFSARLDQIESKTDEAYWYVTIIQVSDTSF